MKRNYHKQTSKKLQISRVAIPQVIKEANNKQSSKQIAANNQNKLFPALKKLLKK